MIDDFESAFLKICSGKTAFIGVGNVDRADDGAGVVFAKRLEAAGRMHIFIGGTTPERVVSLTINQGFDHVVFLDAVSAGTTPGAAVILDAKEMTSRYPQVSTHKISIGTLAQIAVAGSQTTAWLLGIEPKSIALGTVGLSPEVEDTINKLVKRIIEKSGAQLYPKHVMDLKWA